MGEDVQASHFSVLSPSVTPFPTPASVGPWVSSHLDVAPNASQQRRQWLILFIPELPLRLSTPWTGMTRVSRSITSSTLANTPFPQDKELGEGLCHV